VNLHLVLLIGYSIGIVAFGLWTARFVRQSSDFFVAGRSLGPGFILASMLAANIGAGSTVGVAGRAYRDGIATWWWVGAAGLASFVLALWVGPRLWRLAKTHNFYTTGDYLEFRYGPSVRTAAALITCIGALAILAGQLIAGAAILNVVMGIPRWMGALTGGAIMTIYFTAGGLIGTAWVNAVQLIVLLLGFAVALPVALESAGGLSAVTSAPSVPPHFGDFWYSAGPLSGWTYLFLTFPAFIISPGLIQKSFCCLRSSRRCSEWWRASRNLASRTRISCCRPFCSRSCRLCSGRWRSRRSSRLKSTPATRCSSWSRRRCRRICTCVTSTREQRTRSCCSWHGQPPSWLAPRASRCRFTSALSRRP
jgi:Na+/proline symporter